MICGLGILRFFIDSEGIWCLVWCFFYGFVDSLEKFVLGLFYLNYVYV